MLSRVQLSEQSSSEDDDDVLFAVSSAHLTGPSCVVFDLLYDVTCTDNSLVVTGIITCSSSSRSSEADIMFIFTIPCFGPKRRISKTFAVQGCAEEL